MDTIVTVQHQDLDWQHHTPRHNPAAVNYPGGKTPAWEGPPRVHFKSLMRSEKVNVVVAQWDPDHREPTHSHPTDEYMFILEGSATLNGKKLEAGGFFFIPGDTMYSLAAGPEGMKFFRVAI